MDEEQEEQAKMDRMERYHEKVNALMIEFGEEILDEDMKTKLEEKLKHVLKKAGVPYSTASLKAFYEGFTFGMTIARNDEDGQLMIPILGYLKSTIAVREKELSKKADDAMSK